jgi:hypothetical protein
VTAWIRAGDGTLRPVPVIMHDGYLVRPRPYRVLVLARDRRRALSRTPG